MPKPSALFLYFSSAFLNLIFGHIWEIHFFWEYTLSVIELLTDPWDKTSKLELVVASSFREVKFVVSIIVYVPNVLHIFPFYMAFDICKMFSIYFYVGKRKSHTLFFPLNPPPHTHLRKHKGKEYDSEWLWLLALSSQLDKQRAKEGERNGYNKR